MLRSRLSSAACAVRRWFALSPPERALAHVSARAPHRTIGMTTIGDGDRNSRAIAPLLLCCQAQPAMRRLLGPEALRGDSIARDQGQPTPHAVEWNVTSDASGVEGAARRKPVWKSQAAFSSRNSMNGRAAASLTFRIHIEDRHYAQSMVFDSGVVPWWPRKWSRMVPTDAGGSRRVRKVGRRACEYPRCATILEWPESWSR